MLELLAQLFEFIRNTIWPLHIVSAPHKAVLYTVGRPVAILEPDWYFAWPFFQEIRSTNCAEDTIDVANLPITTRDDVQVTVSYNLRYKIIDVLKYQTNLQDTMSSLNAECSSEVALRLRRRIWHRIYKSQGAIERRITKTLTARLSNWGIEVLSGGVTVCAKARPISLINVE